MQKKLTLRLEKNLIEYAKEYASARGTSVSKLVADYFTGIAARERSEDDDSIENIELGPITRSLLGIAAHSDATEEDYHQYLEEKYT